jgi:glycine dehydrogenase subunit 1
LSYVPNTDSERRRMLESIGAESISVLFEQIPPSLILQRHLEVPGPLSEIELRKYASEISRANACLDDYTCFLGAGIYDHYIPSTVAAITGRSEFYTAYTPYQPEISQGNLQAIFEFQSLVCRLTGMDVANASMYDGASALAEAALMATSITGRKTWVVSSCVHPAYRETMRSYAWASGCRVIEVARTGISTDFEDLGRHVTDDTACVVIQNPNFFGTVESLPEAEAAAHEKGALFVVCCDPISLGLLKPPGERNADICVAEGQPLGISTGFGGPLLGIFACKKEFVRQMPGRVVGATTDADGRRGYTLTLQTREQHIRREKATSNICTNEALNALAATVYLATLGKHGLRRVAELCLQSAHYAAETIAILPGYELPFDVPFFKEFVVKCPKPISEINDRLVRKKMIGGLDLGRFYPELVGHMLLCVTEKRTVNEIHSLVEELAS